MYVKLHTRSPRIFDVCLARSSVNAVNGRLNFNYVDIFFQCGTYIFNEVLYPRTNSFFLHQKSTEIFDVHEIIAVPYPEFCFASIMPANGHTSITHVQEKSGTCKFE